MYSGNRRSMPVFEIFEKNQKRPNPTLNNNIYDLLVNFLQMLKEILNNFLRQ